MPTSSPGPSAKLEVHQNRQVAESFGADAERYDRARPHYPQDLVARIAAGSPGPDVLDVGIGTGIAARQFQAAGCTVTGVDVDARMAEVAQHHGIQVDVAKFEDWEPAGRQFDAVIAAQAWHWVDPDAGAVKAAQVLRPGGRLAVFWNVGQPEPGAADAFGVIYQRELPDIPLYRPGLSALDLYAPMFTKSATGIRQTGVFAEPHQWRFDWDQNYTRDEWLDVLPTQGIHNQLPADKLQKLLTAIGTAIDALGGSFTMHYSAVAVTATLS